MYKSPNAYVWAAPYIVETPSPLDKKSEEKKAEEKPAKLPSAIPTFGALGKNGRDFFSRRFHPGMLKLSIAGSSKSSVNFDITSTNYYETGAYHSSIIAKYKLKDFGTTISNTLTSDSNYTLGVISENLVGPGVKLGIELTHSFLTGNNGGRILTGFKNSLVNTTLDVDLATQNIISSAVIGKNGIFGGFQIGTNPSKLTEPSPISSYNLAVAYQNPIVDFCVGSKNNKEFTSTLCHIINSYLEVGAMLSWKRLPMDQGGDTISSQNTFFAMGIGVILGHETSFKAKVDSQSWLGLSLTNKLAPGFWVTLSTMFDLQDMYSGLHKVGFAIDF